MCGPGHLRASQTCYCLILPPCATTVVPLRRYNHRPAYTPKDIQTRQSKGKRTCTTANTPSACRTRGPNTQNIRIHSRTHTPTHPPKASTAEAITYPKKIRVIKEAPLFPFPRRRRKRGKKKASHQSAPCHRQKGVAPSLTATQSLNFSD